MTAPALTWACATLAKANAAAAENEDAVEVRPLIGRYAVCDGATEGWHSGPWARRLANAYVKRPPTPADFPKWVDAVRKGFDVPPATGPAAWYAEAKAEQGSFSTLLGVEFTTKPGGGPVRWKAVAVGDSCLVRVRAGKIVTAFPVENVAGFGTAPKLVPSAGGVVCPEAEWLAGRADPGDLFVLATDAGAAGLLTEAGPDLWLGIATAVGRPSPSERTAGVLEFAKSFQALRNDDVSLVALLVPGSPESSP